CRIIPFFSVFGQDVIAWMGCDPDRGLRSRRSHRTSGRSRRAPRICWQNKRRRTMKPRMNFFKAAPDTIKALVAVEDQIKASGLEHSLIELVKTRASQINGCAYCIDMHTTDARKAGETEQRLYLLNAWRESPLYTDRERAALAWTEALTLIAETHAPDADYEAMRALFSETEAVNLTVLIGAINAWNRVAIGFRAIHPVKAKAAA